VNKAIDTLSPPPPKQTPSSPNPTPPATPTDNTPVQPQPEPKAEEEKIDATVIGVAAGAAVFIITVVFVFTRYSAVQRMITYASLYGWVFIVGVIFCVVGATSVDGTPRWVCIGVGALLILLAWMILFATRRGLTIESIEDDALDRLKERLDGGTPTKEEIHKALEQYKQETEGLSEAVRLVLYLHGKETRKDAVDTRGWWAKTVDFIKYPFTAGFAAYVAANNPEFAIKAVIVAALLPAPIYKFFERLFKYGTSRRAFTFEHKELTEFLNQRNFKEIDVKEIQAWVKKPNAPRIVDSHTA
jgi:Ca2+/Na+ antiporter